MYATEMLWENKRALSNLQDGLKDWLKTTYQIEATTPQKPTSKTFFEETDFYTFSLLRMKFSKCSVAYPLGSQSADFRARLTAILAASITPPETSKTVDSELSKLLYKVLDIELKANQVPFESSGALAVPANALATWATVKATQAVQIPLEIQGKEFIFEIPVTDDEYQNTQTFETFGYPSQSRILVVDDSATSRKLSRHYLGLAGYINIEECVDGQNALTKLTSTQSPFDLAVVDWHMPNMSGFELLKAIRHNPQIKATPVILVTGERNAAEVTNAIKEGVSGYVVKPFEAETLHKAMKKSSPPGKYIK